MPQLGVLAVTKWGETNVYARSGSSWDVMYPLARGTLVMILSRHTESNGSVMNANEWPWHRVVVLTPHGLGITWGAALDPLADP